MIGHLRLLGQVMAGSLKALLLALVFSATVGAEEDSIAAVFEPRPCWVALSDDDPIECGNLAVPLRWGNPTGPKIELAVAVYAARRPRPGLEPVIYLSGGPGYPALGPDGEHIDNWRRIADRFFPGRRVIAFDQRGTGLGSPQLDCPEMKDPRVWGEVSEDPNAFGDSRARIEKAVAACRDRLAAEGHDLAAFTTRQSAADVDALRRALGIDKVILFGISYGTRLALTAMRHYPETIAAAILDSPLPPQAIWPHGDGENLVRVIERLFEACGRYPRCHAAYPDLRERFLEVLKRLARDPVVLEIDNLTSSNPLFVRADDRVFLETLREEMYWTRNIKLMPALIAGLAKGEDWRLRPHIENSYYGSYPRDYDLGMTFSVHCHDHRGQGARPSDLDGTGPFPFITPYVTEIWARDACWIWPTTPPEPDNTAAVVSDIPTLIMAGGLDASTPVELGRDALETLSKGHLVVFPANAHVQLFYGDCPGTVLAAFLANPQAPPAPGCLDELPQASFLALGGG